MDMSIARISDAENGGALDEELARQRVQRAADPRLAVAARFRAGEGLIPSLALAHERQNSHPHCLLVDGHERQR
jgi:hypothetical protein